MDHTLRTFKYCWCDSHASAAFMHGKLAPFYIAEIRIAAWDPHDKRNRKFRKVGKENGLGRLMGRMCGVQLIENVRFKEGIS